MTRRRGDVFTAFCLAGFGLSVAAIRMLANPVSRLSRWVDRNMLSDGVTR